MVAPSQTEHQGEGKVGMANESESLVEAALGKTWEMADTQGFGQETVNDSMTGVNTLCPRSREDASTNRISYYCGTW
jgi:hypothetical protein